jgi:hypothetical protein
VESKDIIWISMTLIHAVVGTTIVRYWTLFNPTSISQSDCITIGNMYLPNNIFDSITGMTMASVYPLFLNF